MGNAKFRIGDKVKVIEDLKGNHRYDNLFAAPEMEQYRGMTGVINRVDTDGHYQLDITNGKYFWSDSMLEPKTFTKADLEPGMVVEYRNGERRLFVNDTFMGDRGYSFISDFTDDLKFDGIPNIMDADNTFDIVKVYRTHAHKFTTVCLGRYLTLVWERKEEEPVKEMTVAEIEEKLGYKVKIVDGDSK